MPTNLFVGNLPFDVNKDEIRDFFSEVCHLGEITFINDPTTRRFRGFAFVDAGAATGEAIKLLNGSKLRGRSIAIKAAHKTGGSTETRRGSHADFWKK